MTKPWEIRNVVNKKAEILIYGPIFPDKMFDDEVGAKEFAEDLKAMGDVTEIELHINSPGGNVFAAQAIYSQLKNHKAAVSVYIDGIAASAASIIAMAGDNIYIPTNAMIMVHNPLTIAIGDAAEMKKIAEMLDKVRDSIIAAYRTKTGKDEAELKELMDNETWMTGQEAVELGFADELLYAVEVAASMHGYKFVINGVEHNLENYSKAPERTALKLFHKLQPEISNTSKKGNPDKEGEKPMNLEELKANHPDLYNVAKEEAKVENYNEGYAAGVKAENERIRAIEDLAIPGNDEIINKAKFEENKTAEQLAVDIVKAQKEKGQEHWENVKKDAEESNASEVQGSDAPEEEAEKKKKEQQDIQAAMVTGGSRGKAGVK